MRDTCRRRRCSAKDTAPSGGRLLCGALRFPGSTLARRRCLPPGLLRALLSLDRYLQGPLPLTVPAVARSSGRRSNPGLQPHHWTNSC